ncbi:MAG: hypothetical protein ACYTAN_16820 [Planctomycetota bacterium]|jgi:hypothetical protein
MSARWALVCVAAVTACAALALTIGRTEAPLRRATARSTVNIAAESHVTASAGAGENTETIIGALEYFLSEQPVPIPQYWRKLERIGWKRALELGCLDIGYDPVNPFKRWGGPVRYDRCFFDAVRDFLSGVEDSDMREYHTEHVISIASFGFDEATDYGERVLMTEFLVSLFRSESDFDERQELARQIAKMRCDEAYSFLTEIFDQLNAPYQELVAANVARATHPGDAARQLAEEIAQSAVPAAQAYAAGEEFMIDLFQRGRLPSTVLMPPHVFARITAPERLGDFVTALQESYAPGSQIEYSDLDLAFSLILASQYELQRLGESLY